MHFHSNRAINVQEEEDSAELLKTFSCFVSYHIYHIQLVFGDIVEKSMPGVAKFKMQI